jgi:CheY-like chemotaxis protein
VNLLVLVVDDEPDVEVLFRQQFRRDLRAGRFVMEFAQSAPIALQRIADAVDQSLILILSDINMPGMSGLELLPKVRAMRPDVPIIMITAYGDAETKRQALENGAEALLTKPIDFGTLRSEIEQRVERPLRALEAVDIDQIRLQSMQTWGAGLRERRWQERACC